ncbi:hypothetical protein JKL49_13290 [Phenylobacterium sp. 20VBR1]|uniref:Uncharacterized protein n=1 Tax=Phenylobacterium glaciei TaxID=2803784 RepID=A0A941D540_9CAUL|nr:hypothetical protein [Phenylobacterium glaciei]MBR7620363.1 hypothetical protein [Phenylobacterium glaciei]QQZ49197.1 hypothetical protein JKL49_18990 [Phenylobacterium glaciei]
MNRFWRNWLTVWAWLVAVFGLVLAGAGLEATDGPTRLIFGLVNGPEDLVLNAQMRFAVALMGAVTLGWAITLMVTFDAAHRLGAQAGPTWRGVLASMAAWFVIDSGLSIATGFGLNAVSNTLLMAGLLLPLLASGVLRKA